MTETFDVLTMGRSCIDLYAHQIGVPITEVTSFDAYVGGCPTNISVGTRRLGLRSALLTAVADDHAARSVPSHLLSRGMRRSRADARRRAGGAHRRERDDRGDGYGVESQS